MKVIKSLALELGVLWIMMLALYGLWVLLEVAYTGAPQPSKSDVIIWCIASWSLSRNVMHLLHRMEGGGV